MSCAAVSHLCPRYGSPQLRATLFSRHAGPRVAFLCGRCAPLFLAFPPDLFGDGGVVILLEGAP